MHRAMRRAKQELSMEETQKILMRNTNGILSVIDENQSPYGVPLSYAYVNDKLYFHCALSGHKLDALRHSPKACFTVVDMDHVVQETFTTHFRSAIAFGTAVLIEDEALKYAALQALVAKYSPDYIEKGDEAIKKGLKHTAIIEMTVTRLTGKAAIELF